MVGRPTYEELEQRIKKLEEEAIKRKRAEGALLKSEKPYRQLVETMTEGLGVQNENGLITYANNRLYEMLGYARDEVVGRPVIDFVDEAFKNVFLKEMAARREGRVQKYELVLNGKNGIKISSIISPRPIFGSDDYFRGSFATITDISERKSLEFHIQHAHKMKAISSLASGVAHQFNNALAALNGNIELLGEAVASRSELKQYTESMKASVFKMSMLTDQLLAYAQGGKYQPRILSLDKLIEQTLPILQSQMNPAIQVGVEFNTETLKIYGDEAQIQMVLSAVIENAAEALEGSGHIKITVFTEELNDQSIAKYPTLSPGPYVCIIIKDDGKGMDEETAKRIFEPFFTTYYQGRGLGMSASYGIVKNHNGWIGIDSTPGRGTVISIYLPALKLKNVALNAHAQLPESEKTILLVEDEKMVREVYATMIQKLGYRAVCAGGGREAIDIAKGFDGNIDMAILDIGLPDMSGKDVFLHINKVRPDIKVIVCSGYSDDSAAQEILTAGARAFIQKPFTFKELSEMIEKITERRKYQRFKILTDAFAIPKHTPQQQFKIIDISKGGLAFSCLEIRDRLIDFSEFDIINYENNFILDAMPCRLISDLRMSDDYPLGAEPQNRRGLKFGHLSSRQMNHLEYFIRHHAMTIAR